MDVIGTTVLGIAMWFGWWRPASRFVTRSRLDVALWVSITGLVSASTGRRFGSGLVGATVVALCVGLVVLTEIDVRTRRLPREIGYPLFALVMIMVAALSWHDGRVDRFVDALTGATLATVVLLMLYAMTRGGLGDGDVRLAPALGSVAAIGGVPIVWSALFVAFVTAGTWVIVLMALGRTNRRATIPFGPFLAGGTVIAVLVSGPVS